MALDDFARYVIAARQMDPLVERKPDSKESGICKDVECIGLYTIKIK